MKVSIGRVRKSRKSFDKSHDVNTTANWGMFQPTLCDEIVGGSSFTIQMHTKVQMSPLVVPTFGRAVVKHYAYFVPMRDVFMSYENLMSGTIYNGGGTSYIPNSAPKSALRWLSMFILADATATAYSLQSRGDEEYIFTPHWEPDSASDIFDDVLQYYSIPSEDAQDLEIRLVQSADTATPEDLVTIQGADVILINYQNDVALAFRLGRKGKQLRKILIGLGCQVNFDSTYEDINICPFLAYFKAWFDLFAIKRENNWQNTHAYNLIQYIAYNGTVSVKPNRPVWNYFKDFVLDELVDTYYVDNPDYFTAHIDSLAKTMTGSGIKVPALANDTDTVYNASITGNANGVSVTGNSSTIIANPVAQRMAQVMLKYINKNTAIGQRIASYFAAHGLGDVDDNKDLSFIGASSVNVDFTEVISTSDTLPSGGEPLGGYKGRGVAVGSSDKLSFNANSSGYVVVLTCVLPRCGYVQGVSPIFMHNERYEFFNPEFEAMFMQVTSRKAFLGSCDVGHDAPTYDDGFGFIPSYSEYKQMQNVANGDITLRSTRNTMLPYILDKWFTVRDFVPAGDDESDKFKRVGYSPFSVNDALRYIGKSEIQGNFDRIFQLYGDEVPNEEPFILHLQAEYKVQQPMLAMRDSFDTDANENDMTIEKS